MWQQTAEKLCHNSPLSFSASREGFFRYPPQKDRQVQRSAKSKDVAETYLNAGIFIFKKQGQLIRWKHSLRKDPRCDCFLDLHALTIIKKN